VVKASIDSTSLLIGQQTLIKLEIAADKDNHLQLPVFSDTIITGIEVLQTLKPDTTDIGNNRIQIKQNYLITSFDSALYLLPPFEVISGTDTAYSNTLGLKVITLPVDTESEQFFDIKNVIQPKFVFADYLGIILLILGVLLLAAAGWYFYKRWKDQKSLIPFKKSEPPLPPHIKAISELDRIKAQKLWQQGRIKEYHSLVTDAIRTYLEDRFDIFAMEMTSGEILGKTMHLFDDGSAYDNLKQMLQLADFVKFAKYKPLPDENELSLMNAYLFVNRTKIEEQLPVAPPDDDNAEENSEKTIANNTEKNS
jgi:hypothetical protein